MCSESSLLAVHQLCALEMFRARINRGKHVLRRKRKKVVATAIAMAGVVVHPIGRDDKGRECVNNIDLRWLYLYTFTIDVL